MNKRLKDKKMMSGIITAGGFLIILAGSALSQQTALGQNYQGVYVDGTFVGYVAENVDVKDDNPSRQEENWQKNLQAVYAWIMNGL